MAPFCIDTVSDGPLLFARLCWCFTALVPLCLVTCTVFLLFRPLGGETLVGISPSLTRSLSLSLSLQLRLCDLSRTQWWYLECLFAVTAV